MALQAHRLIKKCKSPDEIERTILTSSIQPPIQGTISISDCEAESALHLSNISFGLQYDCDGKSMVQQDHQEIISRRSKERDKQRFDLIISSVPSEIIGILLNFRLANLITKMKAQSAHLRFRILSRKYLHGKLQGRIISTNSLIRLRHFCIRIAKRTLLRTQTESHKINRGQSRHCISPL